MFTGIIDHCGTITQLTFAQDTLRLTISCQYEDLQEGESIALDGFCVTCINPTPGSFQCEISPETLRVTTAQYFKVGTSLNLERSLQLSSRLGGHFVLGHVDKTCVVQEKVPVEQFIRVTFNGLAPEDRPYIVKKGCISVNGVSLTINEGLSTGFQVMLIPHTLEHTNLGRIAIGDRINLEFDYLAKLVYAKSPLPPFEKGG